MADKNAEKGEMRLMSRSGLLVEAFSFLPSLGTGTTIQSFTVPDPETVTERKRPPAALLQEVFFN
jgi:hypothetical protein